MKFQDLSRYYKEIELLHGDANEEVVGISHVWEPEANKFCFVKGERFLKFLQNKDHEAFKKCGILFEKSFYENKISDNQFIEFTKNFSWAGTVKNVGQAICLLTKPFYDEKFEDLNYLLDGRQLGTTEIDPTAQIAQNVFIGENVKIGKNVVLHPGVVIMPQVFIDEGTIIYPNTTVYPYVKIGKNCRIHSQVAIGADGFGYNYYDNKHNKIWHFSGVEISDDVEIGATSTVDAGAFVPTRIGKGTIIDNGVQVAHNVQIKEKVILCGQVAVAGSATLEDLCMIGGDACIGPGAILGKGSQIGAASIVSENMVVEQGSKLAGHPARDLNEWIKGMAFVRKESLKGNK